MNQAVFDKNLAALEKRDHRLFGVVRDASDDGSYQGSVKAKSGAEVPLFRDGAPLHSLHDPEREARRLVEGLPEDAFILFVGLAGGYHVREFLKIRPKSWCLAVEESAGSLRSLLGAVDVSDLILDDRVRLAVYGSHDGFARTLSEVYLPALHGGFKVLPLRSWTGKFPSSFTADDIKDALKLVSGDYSVQAHFGRIWLRNCMINLSCASSLPIQRPAFDTSKRALVAAAGPSLEKAVPMITANRSGCIIFSTDTAWGTLAGYGIVPDVVVSIDAQQVSSRQALRRFSRGMTLIMDVCGNPAIAARAASEGASIIFAAGSHPLAQYASVFGTLPPFDTSSGTVTQAAVSAARSLGFPSPEVIGADYAYTNGKPYARGTYLADSFDSRSSRREPSETGYSSIMFRSPVNTVRGPSGITYRTEVMDRYREAGARQLQSVPWDTEAIKPFPARDFFSDFRISVSDLAESFDRGIIYGSEQSRIFETLVPFIAWYRTRHPDEGQNTVKNAIKLALRLIAVYTVQS